MKTHTFCGKTYHITVEELDGLCDTFKKEYELIVMRDLNTQAGLITAIHEALHACNWHSSEVMVDQTSTDIGRFLWRLGYRKDSNA
jgi:hypothetical protein